MSGHDLDDFILLLLMQQHHQLSATVICTARFRQFLHPEERRRRDPRVPRIALVDPTESSFYRLYRSRDDQALIATTGLDHRCFSYLLHHFTPIFYRYSPYASYHGGKFCHLMQNPGNGGRPRTVSPCSCLGLVLFFTRTRGALPILQLVFGLSYSVLCLFLKFGMRILFKLLLREEGAKVALPSVETIMEFMDVVEEKYPALQHVWFVMDGLKVPIERPGHYRMQNAYYNGWLHGHFVGCIFVFVPDGTVVAASVNNPGSLHDSFITENSGTYNKLEQVYNDTGGRGVVDSAFSLKRCPFLIKSGKDPRTNTPNDIIVRDAEATSLRQTAEWGMRGLQCSFPRLKEKITYSNDFRDRKVFLRLIPMLYNFRTNFIGINQIRSHFFPIFERYGDNVADLLE